MRKYVPNVGDRIKLKDMYSYNKHEIPVWAWLKVVRVIPDDTVVFVRVPNSMAETERTAMVELTALQKPLGWQPVYTITCKDLEQAKQVQDDWFKRGIAVWASHDLSSAGRMAYTPVKENEEPGSPHWQYTGNPVETILAPDCEKYFRIEVLHQWEPDLPPTSEKKARAARVKELRAQPGVTLQFVRGYGNDTIPVCERTEIIYEPPKE